MWITFEFGFFIDFTFVYKVSFQSGFQIVDCLF